MADPFVADPGSLANRLLGRLLRLARGRPERVPGTWLSDGQRQETTARGGGPPRRRGTRPGYLTDSFEQARPQRYVDLRGLVDEVPEADSALRVVVDFVFAGATGEQTFNIDTSGARDEVRRIIDDVVAATELHAVLPRVVEEGIWLGDSFTELAYTSSALVGQRSLRPERTRVYEDDDGRVVEYWTRVDNLRRWRLLHPFQVVHYAHRPTRGARYGRSMFGSARHLRRRAEAVQDVAVLLALKKMGGGERILWPFPGEMDNQRIWSWLAEVAEAVDDDYWFDDDGQLGHRAASKVETQPAFMPYRVWAGGEQVRPEVVQSQPADLKSLVAFLEHMQRRYMVATGVPPALAGLDRDVNAKATLEQQGLAFMLTIHNRGRDAARIVADVLTRGLMVAGVVPRPDEFVVTIDPPAQFGAEMRASVLKLQAEAVVALVNAGAPLGFALEHVMELSAEDAQAVVEAAPAPRPDGGVTVESVFEALDIAGVKPSTGDGGVRVPASTHAQ